MKAEFSIWHPVIEQSEDKIHFSPLLPLTEVAQRVTTTMIACQADPHFLE